MNARSEAMDHVFVLRFWQEPADDKPDPLHWRARISEVNTGRQFHAKGFDAACTLVRSLLSSSGKMGAGRE